MHPKALPAIQFPYSMCALSASAAPILRNGQIAKVASNIDVLTAEACRFPRQPIVQGQVLEHALRSFSFENYGGNLPSTDDCAWVMSAAHCVAIEWHCLWQGWEAHKMHSR